jgi:hypothetical protein
VKSSVSAEVFRQFVAELEGSETEITDASFGGLSLLSDEFGFGALGARLSAFASAAALPGRPADAGAQLAAIEARALERDRATAGLQAEVRRLSLAVESLRAALYGEARARREGQAQTEADVGRLCSAVEALRARARRGAGARGLRFPDRRGLSGALRGVPREALRAAVARQPRRLPRATFTAAATATRPP